MPATILDFRTREVYDAQESTYEQLTGLELYRALFEMTLGTLDSLITRYKATGHWNPVADKLMRRMLDDANALCAALAGVKHGSPQKSQARSPVRIAPLSEWPTDDGGPRAV